MLSDKYEIAVKEANALARFIALEGYESILTEWFYEMGDEPRFPFDGFVVISQDFEIERFMDAHDLFNRIEDAKEDGETYKPRCVLPMAEGLEEALGKLKLSDVVRRVNTVCAGVVRAYLSIENDTWL